MMTPKFELIKIAEDQFRLINNDDTFTYPINIYGMFSGEIDKSVFITTSEASHVDIQFSTQGQRPYFLIECAKSHKKAIIAERTLSISGMNNFRDMGGYETISGETIKWGKLYRGDHLFNANEQGLETFKSLNIKTIIDYRSDVEIMKYPNQDLGECITVYHFDPSAHAAELAAQFNSSKEDEDINLINKIVENKKKGILIDHSEVVLTQYRAFVTKSESKKAFSNMLKIVMNNASLPIFQHCRGGKDRTGFGAMLLLGILDVDNSVILYDYLLTAKNREKRNAFKMAKYKELTDDQDVLAHLYSFIAADSQFLETSINEICREYGTISNYAIKELGITQKQIGEFKSSVLEKL